eukprot:CAMPEP_0114543994 /NCGR_PEP_ID=MMETSP0114-20121206/2646_1 /TAXON_ID=31324 /ORGANISM="Goniomonas sp, Strain m" /LENGTH=136 /DNA_ID=CAMNT_0001728357 /DNA_START=555 /DNA_END=965 /DNA_ORIENTATION=-
MAEVNGEGPQVLDVLPVLGRKYDCTRLLRSLRKLYESIRLKLPFVLGMFNTVNEQLEGWKGFDPEVICELGLCVRIRFSNAYVSTLQCLCYLFPDRCHRLAVPTPRSVKLHKPDAIFRQPVEVAQVEHNNVTNFVG